MKFLTAAVTDIGTSRQTNQDSISIKTAKTPIGMVIMAVVCDGMGGMQKGELASAAVVNGFGRWFQQEFPGMLKQFDIEKVRVCWEELLNELNTKILKYGQKHGEVLGTTVTAVLMTEQDGYAAAHVGDTRLYQIKNEVQQLTCDHSLVQREVELGHITKEEAKTDKRRNKLLKCIGARDHLEPQTMTGTTEGEATYLLCSDGFWHELNESEIYEHLKPEALYHKTELKEKIELLIETDKKRQERDNISAILIRTYEMDKEMRENDWQR